MEFFNQKEEVLDIKLTQHGKRQLAKGKFAPKYYAFFDKNILYNSEFAGFSEEQNDTETRIKSETPRLKVQHNFIGVESNFHEMKEIIQNEKKFSDEHIVEALQDVENKYFALDSAVGTTKLKSEYKPAWEVKFYNENLSGSSGMLTGSGTPNINIPQLEAEIEFVTYMTNKPEELNIPMQSVFLDPDDSSDQFELEGGPLEFEDGSAVILEQDFSLLGIDEKNTDFYNENFEIEVFMEETWQGWDGPRSKLTPLQFYPRDQKRADELAEMGIFPDTNTNFVDYYFDLQVDEEIETGILCKYVTEDDKKSIYVKQIFKCNDDVEMEEYANVYEDADLGEPCE
jgi:hypothetical protein